MMEQESYRVLIVGYGEMGHAMQHLLGARHRIAIYDSKPIEGLKPINIEEEASQADFVLLCVPAFPHQALLESLVPHLQNHCICLSIAKGLDEKGRAPVQIYEQTVNGRQPYCLLYGPMISEEIRADRYAFAQLGCSDEAIYEKVRALYRGTKLYIQYSTDITGISWSVILKNVYAMAFGMADELQLGDNVRGFLTVTALEELSSIVVGMGGMPATPYHLAGLGDLITTATSEDSHHHELGRLLARGETEGITGEGVHTLEMIDQYQLIDTLKFPLYHFIHDVLNEPVSVLQKFQTLMDDIQT